MKGCTAPKRRAGFLRGALLTLGLLAGAMGAAEARTVRIISADTLELRQVDGQELVIITGESVELRVDDDVVRARRVEFNRTRRTLTLVGAARYTTAKDGQDLRGENLVVDLGEEQITGEDVLISDDELEIRGTEVERIPGQLRASGGYFTTCARCGRTPNDFAFRAERLIVYPGDRLIAYRAQLLLVDVPVLFLPVLVLPLNERDRQPRLEIGRDARDGTTVEADLPFSIGSNTLGTTLLRYYQNRSPSLGVGVALRSYAPLPYVDRINLYTLANPKPLTADGKVNPGYDLDIDFSASGRIPLTEAVRDLDYRVSVTRRDIGRKEGDGTYGVTNVNFGAKVEYPRFTAEFNYVDRFGPEATTPITTPLKEPEVIIDPKVYTNGNFSLDTRVSAGQYTAQSNPLSRSASAQGINITTTRLEEQHDLSYSAQPWPGADLRLRNTFTGRYYGTGARTVDLLVSGELTQRFNVDNTVTFGARYLRTEGTSPFAFDAVNRRVLSAPVSITLSTVPVRDVRFGISYTRDLFLGPQEQQPLGVTLSVNRLPLRLDASLRHSIDTGELQDFTYNVTLSDPDSGTPKVTPAQPATETQPAKPATVTRSSPWPFPNLSLNATGGYRKGTGLIPFRVGATVTGDLRTNTFTVYAIHDFKTEPVSELGVTYSLSTTRDVVLNPVTVAGRETFYLEPARMSGEHSVTWRGQYRAFTAHDLLLEPPATATSSGTVTFGVGTVQGSANNWNLLYGGPYDLRRGGWTAPTLTGTVSVTRPGQRLGLVAVINVAGLDQKRTELARVDADANWQFGSRAAISGRVLYSRTRSGTFPNDVATDTLTVAPVRATVAIGNGEKPGAYLTASLRQTFTWVDGVRQNYTPISPVIGLTIDRCCWALQAEADLGLGRYRVAVGLPGQSFYPLFDLTKEGFDIPLLP
ncbi:hypothetical protein DEDE109153_09930 [Deinococcus deserti]|uniref:LPS-assembly protein LptD n=1 Tax=Deinococcus deserti (strain DSM 17065 / CIP 109153 / LMG 22923 / VCD115) TaxID=546414 RepID=C1D014_DEIDV|nr:hypothetical protein [Deinococcus deserti]ACO45266.1 Conserved hypothetical protein, precursor [Deinococcus deserti VCD115]